MTAPSTPSSSPVLAVDHVSFTVPDLDRAIDLFVDGLGADVVRRVDVVSSGASPDAVETTFGARVGAHREADVRLARVALAGRDIELFEFSAPDLRDDAPRNCDAGGCHLGLRVADVHTVLDRLTGRGDVTAVAEPTAFVDWNGEWRSWVYTVTDWGLTIELVSTEPVETADRVLATETSPQHSGGSVGDEPTGETTLPPTTVARPARRGV